MSESGFVVPEGQSPPFTVITDTDHSGWIIIASALGLSCIVLFSAIRVFVRCTVGPVVGLDDTFLSVSTVLAVIQSSIVLGAASRGLGKSVELLQEIDLARVQEMYYSSTILFLLALGLSKCSVACLLIRLTPDKSHKLLFNAVLVLMGAWTVGSVFAIALQCNLARPWVLIGETCSGSLLRWQIICALDIASEVGLVGMAIYLVWNLYISKFNKATVIIAFAFRLPLIVAITFRLLNFNQASLSTNPTLLLDYFIIWTQAEQDYSIVTASIPNLRHFISGLATHYGALDQSRNGVSGYQRSGGSYPMANMKPSCGSKSATRDGSTIAHHTSSSNDNTTVEANEAVMPSKWEVTGNNGNANKNKNNTGHVKQDANSVGSNDSRQMIIKKDITWTIEHDMNYRPE